MPEQISSLLVSPTATDAQMLAQNGTHGSHVLKAQAAAHPAPAAVPTMAETASSQIEQTPSSEPTTLDMEDVDLVGWNGSNRRMLLIILSAPTVS